MQLYYKYIKEMFSNPHINHKMLKLSLCLITVEVWLHTFLAFPLDGDEGSASCPTHITPGERDSFIL